jgi:hypothetical protein
VSPAFSAPWCLFGGQQEDKRTHHDVVWGCGDAMMRQG